MTTVHVVWWERDWVVVDHVVGETRWDDGCTFEHEQDEPGDGAA